MKKSRIEFLSSWRQVVIGFFLLSSALSLAPAHGRELAEHVPGEVLVRLRGSGPITRFREFQANKVHVGELTYRLRIESKKTVEEVIRMLSSDPAVEIAEPNYIYHRADIGPSEQLPNDPRFSSQWSFNNTEQPGSDIQLLPAWNKGFTGDKKIKVAVIDGGVNLNHADLKDNIFTNVGEIPDNEIDDDGNGYVDDVHGWNSYKDTGDADDDDGHGSHCAGVIGARGNNGVGIAGINWNVTIVPVKFLNWWGTGTLESALEAIEYARKLKVQVMSNSWGGGPDSQLLSDLIEQVGREGILFVAAAGNYSTNNDERGFFPANYNHDNMISVAAIDKHDKIASFSNYGVKLVHVAAPGVDIVSTVKRQGYDSYSGTSMAAPHVAGIAALMLSVNPNLTPLQIKQRLISTSDPVPGLETRVMSGGRVNVRRAIGL